MVILKKLTKSLMISPMELLMRMLLAQAHLSYGSVQMMALTRMILGKKPDVAYTHYTGRYYHLIRYSFLLLQ
jgi:hypothetical protein